MNPEIAGDRPDVPFAVHVSGCGIGGLLGVKEFPATAAGYGRLLSWLGGFGTVCLVGIEGTGSYGADLDVTAGRDTSMPRVAVTLANWSALRCSVPV